MTQYIQDNLPTMDEQLARIQQADIDRETTQMHLARWFVRYGKYEKYMKNPEFKKRCEQARMIIATQLMGRAK